MHDKTILLIDNNEELSRAYQKRLYLDGLQVVVCRNAVKAIDYIRSLPVALVISEYHLADMSIHDLIEITRVDMGHILMPFIVLTNHDSFSDIRKLDQHKNCDFLIKKAVSATALSDRIKQVLEV